MAGAEGIRAGRAYVELGTNNAPLKSGLRQAAAQVKAFGQGMQAMGAGMVRGGVVMGLPVGVGAKFFADFESWMARTKALASPTADEFAALSEKALQLGRDTVFTATDAAKTMSIFAQSGLKANEILAATGPTLDLAATGMLDMATSADISLKVMKGMGLQADQLGQAVDVLAKAMVTANTDLVQLGEAFKYVGPVAKSAGMSIYETTAAVQLLSDAGIQADMAGTTLRGMILSLASPSEEASKELERLGVRAVDAAGQFRGLNAIVADMEAALAGVGTGTRLKSLGTIFSARQAAGAAELIAQGGAKLAKYTAALKEAGGTSAAVAATQLDTLTGAWKILQSSLEGVVISIGRAVAPMLRRWGEALVGVTNHVNALVEKNPELFQTLAKVSAGLIVGGVAFFALGAALTTAASIVGVAAAAFAGLAAVLKFGVLVYFNKTFLAVRQLSWLLVLPGAADKAKSAWAGLAATVRATAAAVSEVVARMRQDVGVAAEAIGEALAMGDLAAAAEVAMLAVRVVWAEALDNLSNWWDGVMDRMGAGLSVMMAEEARKLQSTWIDLTSFLGNAWDQLVAALKVGWNEFSGFLKKTWESNKFWLSDEEQSARAAAIDAQVKAANDAAWSAAGAAIGARNADAAASQAAIREEMARYEAQQVRTAEALAAARAAQGGTAGPLRDELAARRDALAGRRAEADLEEYLKGMAAASAGGDLAGRAAEAGRGLSAAMRAESAGSFSSFGLSTSFAYGKGLAERTADAAEETARNTKKIADEGGGRFG